MRQTREKLVGSEGICRKPLRIERTRRGFSNDVMGGTPTTNRHGVKDRPSDGNNVRSTRHTNLRPTADRVVVRRTSLAHNGVDRKTTCKLLLELLEQR